MPSIFAGTQDRTPETGPGPLQACMPAMPPFVVADASAKNSADQYELQLQLFKEWNHRFVPKDPKKKEGGQKKPGSFIVSVSYCLASAAIISFITT